jgi:hypothetical protein
VPGQTAENSSLQLISFFLSNLAKALLLIIVIALQLIQDIIYFSKVKAGMISGLFCFASIFEGWKS